MAQEWHEFTGKSVDEAVAEGLKALQLRADQVAIEVLNKGSRGIFGIGSEPAQVRLTLLKDKPAQTVVVPPSEPELSTTLHPEAEQAPAEEEPPVPLAPAAASQPAELSADEDEPGDQATAELESIASEMLQHLVTLMGFHSQVQAAWKEGGDEIDEHDGPYLLLNVKGEELGVLIGRRGETLDSLQYLLRLMINQRLHRWTNVIVDVDGYKERRATQLHQLALRTATQVAQSGRSISLEPMPANERRIVHMVLRDHPEVYTESSGEGDRRKVHIIAKD